MYRSLLKASIIIRREITITELWIDTKCAEFRFFSGASGELFNMTYRAVLANGADIFAAITQDVCNCYYILAEMAVHRPKDSFAQLKVS